MITSKYIAVITAAVMVLGLFACGFFVYGANAFDTTKTTEYQKKMFNNEVASIDIQVDADEWQAMINNAQAKEWLSADVVVNGTRFGTVGIRTKGNSSLSMGGMGGSSVGDSYSLNFKANKYVKGQTFFGLDTFCVNNMLGDATYMKDYIAYDIMNYIGVDTPLVSYAKVTVNGEDYGFGIMLERYDEAYLDRVHNTSAGELYSVKIGFGQRRDFENMWQDVQDSVPARPQGGNNAETSDAQGGERLQGGRFGGGGIGGGVGGGSLVYTDDNPDSYSSIFNNSVKNSDKISDSDKEKVIAALKNLNAGTDLEKYIDVDATLRYFAAHTVMVNSDSYTSNMAQNYYLYERNGQLTILPWDYNLSFGGMGGMGGTSGASSIVNFPIDTPVSGVSIEDRPLLNKLLEVDEYSERYHEYLRQIVEGYFDSGLYKEKILNLDAKINSYVKNDVSANYTYEQYEASLPQFIELLHLRAESIKGQLDGTIPATSSGQNTDSSSLIDTSGVDLNTLGSMGGGLGGGREGAQGGVPNMGEMPEGGGIPNGGRSDMNQMMQAIQILEKAGWELTDEVKAAITELGIPEEQIDMFANMQGGFLRIDEQGGFPGGNQGNMQGGNNTFDSQVQANTSMETAITIGVLILILFGAMAFVAKPRKNMV